MMLTPKLTGPPGARARRSLDDLIGPLQ